MAKNKTIFFCKECGHESAKWLGQCPGCRQWDTFVEEPVSKKIINTRAKSVSEPQLLQEIVAGVETRMESGIGELDRVLGGGIVSSLVLVGEI